MGKFYVVWKGRNPGVYDNWDDCREQVVDFPGAIFKSFATSAEATTAFRKAAGGSHSSDLAALLNGAGRRRADLSRSEKQDYMLNPEIDLNGWAVDASCPGNPGPVEYRGVELMSGRELFRVGPLQGGSNNMGEFLAIVHALALMAQRGEKHTIYSDSLTGMSWVRNRKIKTLINRDNSNQQLFSLLERGIHWLNTHTYSAPIMKWDTKRWGEIPADFGRKG